MPPVLQCLIIKLEITFLSKKCVKGPIKKSTKKYPVKDLDQPNRASKEDYNLIF